MQEKIIDRLRRSAKKVAAIGTSVAMASLSLTGTLAADLSDLPGPFITNGVFDSYVVVGASAATADVVGAIEVATVLGQLATSSASASGTALLGVTQFAGKSTAIAIDALKTSGVTNGTSTWAASKADDLTILDDLQYTDVNSVLINVSETVTVNLTALNITLSDFSIDTPVSEFIKIAFTTNQTNGQFGVGDKIKWGSELLEVTKIDYSVTPKLISIGTTNESDVNWYNPTFEVGGSSFELVSVPESNKALVKPAGADNSQIVEINSSDYRTVGGVELKVKTGSTTASADYFKATLLTQAIAYKDMQDEGTWLGDPNWKIDTLSINESGDGFISSLIVRNAFTITDLYEGGKKTLHEDLDFVFEDDDAKAEEGNLSLYTSFVNVSEQSKVSMQLLTVWVAAPLTDFDVNTSGQLTLPGVTFARAPADALYNTPVVGAQTDVDYVNETYTALTVNNSEYLLVLDANQNYELAIQGTTNDTFTYKIPSVTTNLSNEGAKLTRVLTANHTTPSGIFVDISTNTLSVKAIRVDAYVDAANATYYGRAGSNRLAGETAAVYTDVGGMIDWTSGSQTAGVLTVTEPKGGEAITVDVTFDINDTGAFALNDVKVGGAAITFTGLTDALDYETEVGTLIGNATAMIADLEAAYSEATGVLLIGIPQYQIGIGLGGYTTTDVTLDTDASDSTYSNFSTIGNTTVELKSGAGSSVTVNDVTVGFARLDSDSMVSESASLSKPVIIVGGWAVNNLAKELVDGALISSARLLELGTEHAGIYFVEEAFNSKSALAIIGYDAADTVLAARTVASALASQTPIDFSTYAGDSVIYLDTGVEAVSGVTVVVDEVVNTTA
jgi:hypothetical protein